MATTSLPTSEIFDVNWSNMNGPPENNIYYVVAGNHAEFINYRLSKMVSGIDLNKTSYVYVSGPQVLYGLSEIKGVFIGSFEKRSDIREIKNQIAIIKSKKSTQPIPKIPSSVTSAVVSSSGAISGVGSTVSIGTSTVKERIAQMIEDGELDEIISKRIKLLSEPNPMKGVRVDGDKVIISTKDNDTARQLCGVLVQSIDSASSDISSASGHIQKDPV